MKFISEYGDIGTLQVTQTEKSSFTKRGLTYRWVSCLALLDENGKWLYCCYWRSNAWKKAEKELIEAGFKKID